MRRTRLARTAGMLAVTVAAFCSEPASAAETGGPAVPGYRRFHAGDDDAAGGRLLIGELNCTACHAAEGPMAAWVSAKPAPVLDAVATRVKPEYLLKFLADPQGIDPGTTMPHLFAGVDPAKRDEQVTALVHFLASGGTVPEVRSDPAATRKGERLFHSIGCAVCHGPRKEGAETPPTAVPLGDLGVKYGITSLAEFLRDPHAVRPGGRMPSFNLDEKQALDVAHFLIPDANVRPKAPRLTYKVYEGSYGNLPDFKTLTAAGEGQADGFDIGVSGRDDNYALVFEGFLKIEKPGEYWFILGSDDGSRLFIDGQRVVNNDGTHPYQGVRGATKLEPGVHPLRLEYAQAGGEQKLTLDYEGPGVPKQPAANAVYLTREAKLPEVAVVDAGEKEKPFRLDPSQIEKGRELFASLGCASCHQKKQDDKAIASTKTAPALAALSPGKGCLAESPAAPAVNYGLTAKQRASIASALANRPAAEPNDAERIDLALVRFNCYACHVRGEKGGVEEDRNALFTTAVPEMGDEGRIPPHLTGIGDKLNTDWLRHVLAEGADDRKYMRTRMPKFGADNVGFLADAFAKADARTEVTFPTLDLPKHRVEAVGRQLVGESALSCIKCHNFGEFAGTGIQAINLQTMTRRLRKDWFFRYMPDPQEYRPGTRMPSAFNKGRSAVRDVLDGDQNKQLEAIWTFLSLGPDAPPPAGAIGSAIVLEPKDKPIVYRNFLEGLSPRGIAVGYPEKANLAFDADAMSMALIWHNAFIDASKHWRGRGNGNQRPLGDHVLSLVRGVPVAVLADAATPWPDAKARDQGWRFHGYKLDAKGRPVFRYGTEALDVEDAPQPISAQSAGTTDAVLHRTITVTAANGGSLPEHAFLRLAAGQTIEQTGGRNYKIDGGLTVRLSPHPDSPAPIVRESEGRKELLLPLPASREARVEVDYEW